MTKCIYTGFKRQTFGYKRNENNKTYAGKFDVRECADKFEIWSLKIFPRYRNKGYATCMLTEFLQQFKSEKPLVLYVYKRNEIAIKLYKKVGFVIIDDYGADAYTMQYMKGN